MLKKTYKMEDLDCAHCAAIMEREIGKLPGVTACTVSFLTQKLTIETDGDSLDEIIKEAVKICRKVEPDCIVHVK